MSTTILRGLIIDAIQEEDDAGLLYLVYGLLVNKGGDDVLNTDVVLRGKLR